MDADKLKFDYTPLCFAKAKEKMCQLKTNESIFEFYKTFAALVKDGAWVSAPSIDKKIRTVTFRGGEYIPIYSKTYNYKADNSNSILVTDINKFIDMLYENPKILGIVLDPDNEPFLINRRAIHELTIRKDIRLQQKNWGQGIPMYTEKDIMVSEELLDFGMQVVEDYYIKNNGFTILETNFSPNCFPHFALQKNGKIYLLVVKVAIGDRPSFTEREKKFYISNSNKFHAKAKCLCAPIGIVSSDAGRAKEKLALYGDGFYVDFNGVIELN